MDRRQGYQRLVPCVVSHMALPLCNYKPLNVHNPVAKANTIDWTPQPTSGARSKMLTDAHRKGQAPGHGESGRRTHCSDSCRTVLAAPVHTHTTKTTYVSILIKTASAHRGKGHTPSKSGPRRLWKSNETRAANISKPATCLCCWVGCPSADVLTRQTVHIQAQVTICWAAVALYSAGCHKHPARSCNALPGSKD